MNTSLLIVSGLVFLGIAIWTAVDAGSHPDWAWQRAGQNKMLWILLPILLALFCGIFSLIPVIIYHTSIKGQVVAAESGGGGGYGGGGPYG
ncbi:MAG TPA: hypothetical protein VGJ86_00625 [Acidimicrobiales bacterium]|jgi:hypothetical protein